MKGYKKCPEWLKKVYLRSANHTCQLCNKSEMITGKLTPHRIKRGKEGGLYTLFRFTHKENNVKIVCTKCHKLLHGNEFRTHSY